MCRVHGMLWFFLKFMNQPPEKSIASGAMAGSKKGSSSVYVWKAIAANLVLENEKKLSTTDNNDNINNNNNNNNNNNAPQSNLLRRNAQGLNQDDKSLSDFGATSIKRRRRTISLALKAQFLKDLFVEREQDA
ncbi:hypothetical protein EDD21DRAFT_356413 [Dissophora ornata]|nr:hypothetical protein EDD21DRAFT_356413 [Dissophora ornata]